MSDDEAERTKAAACLRSMSGTWAMVQAYRNFADEIEARLTTPAR